MHPVLQSRKANGAEANSPEDKTGNMAFPKEECRLEEDATCSIPLPVSTAAP